MDTRCIMISAGRGGVGCSSLAVGLARAIASQGKSAVLLDYDLSERSLDILLGVEDRVVYDLGDLLTAAPLSQVALPIPSAPRLTLIPGAYHLSRRPDTAETERLLSRVKRDLQPDFLICDTGSISDGVLLSPFVDEAIIAVTPSVLSLRSATSCVDLLLESGLRQARMVVTRYSLDVRSHHAVALRQLIDRTGMRLLGIVPEEPENAALMADGRVPEGNLAVSYANIAVRLVGGHAPLLSSMRGIRREKLLASET